MEINPLRVYQRIMESCETEGRELPEDMHKGVTAEEAAETKVVKDTIAPRIKMLHELANSFLDTIERGLEEIPYGIRWICKQIRNLARRKYPNADDDTLCTLIGGFFFLRFINPAIISPISYMLIESAPEENPKRSLTYVAKMLQNLANKPSYSKEPYMTKLQPFLDENKGRIQAFLLKICEVPDFYESLEMDNYVALSKKDLELQITLNEVYSTHELIQKHAEALVSPDTH